MAPARLTHPTPTHCLPFLATNPKYLCWNIGSFSRKMQLSSLVAGQSNWNFYSGYQVELRLYLMHIFNLFSLQLSVNIRGTNSNIFYSILHIWSSVDYNFRVLRHFYWKMCEKFHVWSETPRTEYLCKIYHGCIFIFPKLMIFRQKFVLFKWKIMHVLAGSLVRSCADWHDNTRSLRWQISQKMTNTWLTLTYHGKICLPTPIPIFLVLFLNNFPIRQCRRVGTNKPMLC